MQDITPAEQFMSRYYAETDVNPFHKNERVWRGKPVVIDLGILRDRIWLCGIRSVFRGEGNGSLALRWLCALADECGATIIGIAKPFASKPRLTSMQLKQWYKRNGFTVRRDGHMFRTPEFRQGERDAEQSSSARESKRLASMAASNKTLATVKGSQVAAHA